MKPSKTDDLAFTCAICKHYRTDNKCAAFPNGIPSEIANGQLLHIKPYPGDNNIQFESTLDDTASQQ